MPTITLYDHTKQAASLDIEQLQFEPSGPDEDKTSRLLATLHIGSLMCHLEAIAVKVNEQNEQVADNEEFESVLTGMYLAAEPSQPFQTIELSSRNYVFFLTPRC